MIRVAERLARVVAVVAFSAALPAFAQEKLETTTDSIPGFDVKIELVKLPAGKIEMGTRGKAEARAVEIKPVWMGRTEVTWDLFTLYYQCRDLPAEQKANGVDAESRPTGVQVWPDRGFGTDGYAVISFSAKTAQMYCEWLSRKTGRKYRLPTEAEWEYACRAGGPEVRLSKEELHKVAWVAENAEETPHPVGKKTPNAWGLHDMLGNVGKWALGMDEQWVQKGGSWFDPGKQATSDSRAPYDPKWQETDPQDPKSSWWYADGWHVGFRVVREE